MAARAVNRLSCLELRGGNRAAVHQAQLPGLDTWISCRPLLPATRGGDLYYLSVCSQERSRVLRWPTVIALSVAKDRGSPVNHSIHGKCCMASWSCRWSTICSTW